MGSATIMAEAMKRSMIVLSGPTAVGKTKLSIALAKAVGGEIVSADSVPTHRQAHHLTDDIVFVSAMGQFDSVVVHLLLEKVPGDRWQIFCDIFLDFHYVYTPQC